MRVDAKLTNLNELFMFLRYAADNGIAILIECEKNDIHSYFQQFSSIYVFHTIIIIAVI